MAFVLSKKDMAMPDCYVFSVNKNSNKQISKRSSEVIPAIVLVTAYTVTQEPHVLYSDRCWENYGEADMFMH